MADAVTYKVKIVFVDGETLIIDGASNITLLSKDNAYSVEKNGYRIFFNQEQVKYIGRQFDVNN